MIPRGGPGSQEGRARVRHPTSNAGERRPPRRPAAQEMNAPAISHREALSPAAAWPGSPPVLRILPRAIRTAVRRVVPGAPADARPGAVSLCTASGSSPSAPTGRSTRAAHPVSPWVGMVSSRPRPFAVAVVAIGRSPTDALPLLCPAWANQCVISSSTRSRASPPLPSARARRPVRPVPAHRLSTTDTERHPHLPSDGAPSTSPRPSSYAVDPHAHPPRLHPSCFHSRGLHPRLFPGCPSATRTLPCSSGRHTVGLIRTYGLLRVYMRLEDTSGETHVRVRLTTPNDATPTIINARESNSMGESGPDLLCSTDTAPRQLTWCQRTPNNGRATNAPEGASTAPFPDQRAPGCLSPRGS
jgi:hypothetical protein